MDREREIDALIEAGLGDLEQDKIPHDWRDRLSANGDVEILIEQIEQEWKELQRQRAKLRRIQVLEIEENERKRRVAFDLDLAARVMNNERARTKWKHRTWSDRIQHKADAMARRRSSA